MEKSVQPLMVGNNISKTFYPEGREPTLALSSLSYEVYQGEFISLVGPSGCGKSTLLNIIGAIFPPTTGSVKFKGAEIVKPIPDIGMMFQTPVLFPWRNTYENIMLYVDIKRKDRKEYKERAENLQKMLGLQDFAKSYPWELSGGMQQRVALGRLLLQNPEMMLMDEPFGSLDEFTREALNLELLKIWEGSGKSVLFVTHSIQEAVFMADRIFIFTCRPGKMAKIISPALPRPRRIEMMRERKFQDVIFEVRTVLGENIAD